MRTVCIIIFISFLPVHFLQAQTIKGKVIDRKSSQPVEFANVILLQVADSSYVAGTTTDDNGAFFINISNPINNYLLCISYIGYETQIIKLTNTDAGKIELIEDFQSLSEVTVTATMPQFKMENSGISANIQNSRLRDIGTAYDILEQLPLVTKVDNKFTVFGKGTPLIYINDRLVLDLSELERINSDHIKKVTIVTHPGAEYDATVKSVIKIETVKPTGEGFSGSAMGRFIKNKKFGHNEWVNLNYRIKNLDLFGKLSFSQDKNLVDWRNLMGSSYNNKEITVTELNEQNDHSKFIVPNLGFNYTFGHGHSAGVKYEMAYSKLNYDSESILNVFSENVQHDQINSNRGWDRKQNRHL